MLLDKAQIESYIPHRAPMLLVDRLTDATADRFLTEFTVLPDTIFLEKGRLREYALIEHIAQSGAVGLNYLYRKSKKEPQGGVLGSIAKLTLFDWPAVGDTVQTTVYLLHQLADMYLLKGECVVSGKKMLECRMTLVGLMAGGGDLE